MEPRLPRQIRMCSSTKVVSSQPLMPKRSMCGNTTLKPPKSTWWGTETGTGRGEGEGVSRRRGVGAVEGQAEGVERLVGRQRPCLWPWAHFELSVRSG